MLVLCPKKLADNWTLYNSNDTTNLFAKDRFNYDVLNHTDLSRDGGESLGNAAGPHQLGQLRPRRHRRVAQLPQQPTTRKERETRYDRLMRKIIREGVKTKVLMLSATPVNNRFTDLRNQIALAYEGDSDAARREAEHPDLDRGGVPAGADACSTSGPTCRRRTAPPTRS